MTERCRICLTYQQNVVNLQMRKKIFGVDMTIADQINSFCQLDVMLHGSKVICLNCAGKSHIAYMFLQDCKRSTEILLEEFKIMHGPRVYIFRPELEDPESVNNIESNCNLEPEIEIDVFRPELEQADSNISIEEFNWDQKPDILPERSSPDLNRESAVHEEVTEKTTPNINKRRNITKPAPILSCKYCPKKYRQKAAYLVHMSKHREDKDTVEQSTKPERPKSLNNHEILKQGNATLDRQTETFKGHDVSLHSQNWTEISQMATNAENTKSETPSKKPGFPCRFCMHVSKNRKSHSTHERTHQAPYACRFCDQVQQTLKELVQHLRQTHLSEARFICDTCGKTFFDDKNLQLHQNTHSGIKPHMCHFCGSAFAWKGNLIHHLRTHTGEKKYTCFTCGKAFVQLSSLRAHEDSHNVVKKYTCDVCGVKHFRADLLRKHKREKHGVQNTIFPCEFCTKEFHIRSQFSRHMRTHTAEPRHVCGTCGKRFLKRWNCQVHERMHSKERPYKCELCEKTFTQAHCMRSHMALHTEKKSSNDETLPARDLQEGETATDSGLQDNG